MKRYALPLFLAVVLLVGAAPSARAQDVPQGQELLKMVQAPAGFDATIFAAPPDINYPTVITPDLNGGLFIGIDKNSSLDQKQGRGDIIHATDTDGDGRADRFVTFVDSIDSPRGLVYDGRTLYVMHPPTLTAYRDTDADGKADWAKNLVRGLGFGLDFRGADHTTNGIQMGIDGWIYIAVGDYGFTQAVGADGTRLTHRGGGIVRVRPDGSGLELVATGLRNVYDITLDPYLNGFVRGNTNDGGGWNVRLNHIVHGAHYGYPSLFKHFADEVMPPLADYGAGSGTSAYFVHTPAFPDSLNHVLYTADWGRSMVYRHPRQPHGASFTVEQKPFLRIPTPTDIVMDDASHMYVSSWFMGGYFYSNENVGFVLRLTPPGGGSTPLTGLAEAESAALVDLLGAENEVHRLQAQRAILRRGTPEAFAPALRTMATSAEQPLYARVAAIFTLKQLRGADAHDFLLRLTEDAAVRAFALRALADRTEQLENVPTEPFVAALDASDPRVQREALTGLVRLDAQEAADNILPLTAAEDPVLSHLAVQALVSLRAADAALAAVDADAPGVRRGALQVLKRLHTAPVVQGLITEVRETQDAARRQVLLAALARLYHQPGPWAGEWWGTQPSTRGPYYEPVTWAQSDAIRPVLREALRQASGAHRDTLLALFERNRVLPIGANALLQYTAQQQPALEAAFIDALIGEKTVPAEAAPLLRRAADQSDSLQAHVTRLLVAQERGLAPESLPLLRQTALDAAQPVTLRRDALQALGEAADAKPQARAEAFRTVAELGNPNELPAALAAVWRDFVGEDERAEQIDYFVERAQHGIQAQRTLGYAVLLAIAGSDDDDIEQATRDRAQQTITAAWAGSTDAAALLRAIGYVQAKTYADQVRSHLTAEDPTVQEAAAFAAQQLKLDASAPGG